MTTLVKELGADNENRIRKSNEVKLTLENHELMGIHSTIEQLMLIQIDFRSSYWISRTYDRLEAAFKKIKKAEDDLIMKYATRSDGNGKHFIDKPEDAKTEEEATKLFENMKAFKQAIKELHSAPVEVEVFTVDISHFIKQNSPNLVSFEGRFWSLLKDIIVGEPDDEAMKFLSMLDDTKTIQPSKIVTQ